MEAEELELGCDEGLFETMDYNAIGGKDTFLPAAVNECGVGAIVWSTALSYDGDKLGANPPKSWADFFDVQKFPGKRGLRKGPKYALEFALMGDGVAPADVYKVLKTPEGVDRAFKKLGTIKDNIVWWEAGAQPPQLLASGEVVMTAAYNGRIAAANMSDKRHFKIVWPEYIYAVDSWVILKGSPNKANGLKFIAFASDPKRQAQLPEMVTFCLLLICVGSPPSSETRDRDQLQIAPKHRPPAAGCCGLAPCAAMTASLDHVAPTGITYRRSRQLGPLSMSQNAVGGTRRPLALGGIFQTPPHRYG